ncbi:MAG: Kdo hydroxylase family protein [Pirellulales bacterium]|nr:Kdo hydroxylase family protein [Pirellulales bacterium]
MKPTPSLRIFNGSDDAMPESSHRPTTVVDASSAWCRQLEEGKIVYFAQAPFELPTGDREFLLGVKQTAAKIHKNIAYRPHEDRLTGLTDVEPADAERARAVMASFSRRVTGFLAEFLTPYSKTWRLDFASFRPVEERGRDLRKRARNDLLHVDSFATRPTGGDRILRVFLNINPTEARRWVTTDTFDVLLRRFGAAPQLRGIYAAGGVAQLRRAVGRLAKSAGLPVVVRPPYDEFMLSFHNFLKEHDEFQANCPKQVFDFPPGSVWIAYTDMVSHAVLSGRFALEQTFLISRESLVAKELAPISLLERYYKQQPTETRRAA